MPELSLAPKLAAAAFIVVGSLFFLAGTVGMLRFPDTQSRLHALTKADTLGLGFTALGLALLSGSISVAVKLLFIWIVALTASSAVCYLIAQASRERS